MACAHTGSPTGSSACLPLPLQRAGLGPGHGPAQAASVYVGDSVSDLGALMQVGGRLEALMGEQRRKRLSACLLVGFARGSKLGRGVSGGTSLVNMGQQVTYPNDVQGTYL